MHPRVEFSALPLGGLDAPQPRIGALFERGQRVGKNQEGRIGQPVARPRVGHRLGRSVGDFRGCGGASKRIDHASSRFD